MLGPTLEKIRVLMRLDELGRWGEGDLRRDKLRWEEHGPPSQARYLKTATQASAAEALLPSDAQKVLSHPRS